jgi:hypothetical protein
VQTTSQRPTSRNRAAAQNLPYPKLPGVNHRLFWLAVFLCELSESVALEGLIHSATRGKCSDLECFALLSARVNAATKQAETVRYLRAEGLLLFAHHGTTALDPEVSA